MKIIYSFDTQQGKELPGTFYVKMAELSVFSAKQTGLPVELYTDFAGAVFFRNAKFQFDAIHVVNFKQFDYNSAYWNFGKLYTYSLQDAPFLHIDFDVYLHPGFTIPENCDIITEMLRNYTYVQAFKDISIFKVNQIPEKLICSGLLGGYNPAPFKELFDFAKKICKKNIKEEKAMSYLVGVEEFNLSVLADFYDYKVCELDRNYFSHFQGENKQQRFGKIIDQLYSNIIKK